ncbi:MAG: hypothetical protein Q9160_006745 [Pyrenula sp. 1 TL-2023]
MADNNILGKCAQSTECLPPFKFGDISDRVELLRMVNDSRGYDIREMTRSKKIQKCESLELFHMPRMRSMTDQLRRFATQCAVETQIPDSLPPGSLADIYALDVVFVAIDFEGRIPENPPSEIGIATLDTRDLKSITTSSTSPSIEAIKSQRYAMNYKQKFPVSHHTFCFGHTQYIEPNSGRTRVSVLMESLFIQDKQPNFPTSNLYRNIVLVGHNFYAELDTMSSLGIRSEAFSHVVGILDTERIGRKFLEMNEYPGLNLLLRRFDCPYRYLHNAGNDATFTLRVLLLMAAKLGQSSAHSSLEMTRLARLKEIALAPFPDVQARPKVKPIVTNKEPKRRRDRVRKAWRREDPLTESGDYVEWVSMLSGLQLNE